MKIWKITLRRSSGVNNTLRQSLSLQSFSVDNLWEIETMQFKPGDRQRGSTTNNIETLTLDVCFPPRIFISFAIISNNKQFHPDSRTLLAHIHKKFFLPGHTKVDRNGKMSPGRTYNWHSICLRWSDLLMQDHAFLRHSMEKQHLTINCWIYKPYQCFMYSLQFWWICLPAMTSAWYFKEPLRNETQNFLISKLCFPWLVYTLTPSNPTHYYLISSNLPITTKTTKKFPAWRSGWYELFRYSQWQMATDFKPTFQT